MRSIIISLTVPPTLLAQVDELARRENETRSWVMRRAMRKYVREAGVDQPVVTWTEAGGTEIKMPTKPPRDLTEVMKKHPLIDPNDKELLEFLDDYENNRL